MRRGTAALESDSPTELAVRVRRAESKVKILVPVVYLLVVVVLVLLVVSFIGGRNQPSSDTGLASATTSAEPTKTSVSSAPRQPTATNLVTPTESTPEPTTTPVPRTFAPPPPAGITYLDDLTH